METETFLGLECLRFGNEALSFLVTQSVGPRILTLRPTGGENLFAEAPDFTLDCPGQGQMHLWGGHRLWYAPEVPARTYLPDEEPVTITADSPHTLVVTQPVEKTTGLQKSLRLHLPDDSAAVIVDHTLTNRGPQQIGCAPWAITQLKPGGVAILPQQTETADASGVLPNRHIALWPYTDVNSDHIQWGNRFIFVHATMTQGKLKLGWPNSVGWLAYHWHNVLFVKQATYQPNDNYLDRDTSSQCFCEPAFIELETLGPLVTLAPGESVSHRETWRVFTDVELTIDAESVAGLADKW